MRGKGLARIEAIESPRAIIQLGASMSKSGNDDERTAIVQLNPGLKQGDLLAVALKVQGLSEPISLANVFQVAGPKPRIMSAKVSLPENLAIALREGELPAGSFVGFALAVENPEEKASLQLQCAEQGKALHTQKAQVGEKLDGIRVEEGKTGALFLSLDPGSVGRSGCTLTATVETASSGPSNAYTLGRVVHLPRIESFSLTDEKLGDGVFAGTLRGQALELIEKTGWEEGKGLPVPTLPVTVGGQGQLQTLKIAVPWSSPSPRAPLLIWLRGETNGRLTRQN